MQRWWKIGGMVVEWRYGEMKGEREGWGKGAGGVNVCITVYWTPRTAISSALPGNGA